MEKNENFKSELETQYTILIQAQEKSEQRRFIALFIVVCLTLITVIVSTVFAYAAYRKSSNLHEDTTQQEKTFYQTLSVAYNNSANLNLDNIVTGYRLSTPKVIEISNNGDTELTYNIKISAVNTSLLSTNNLFYIIKSNGEAGSTKQLPLSDKVILDNVKLEPKETKTYTIDVVFQGTIPQEETNNYYHASILVEQVDDKANLLE